MIKDISRQFVSVVTFVLTLIVNGLANALPLNGQTTGAISDRFPVYFVPAGYVFSIWGLIYLLLGAFTVYQALPAQRANPVLRRIGFLPAIAGLFNSAWIFAWHYNQFPLSLAIMAGLLVTLIAIYLRLDTGRSPAGTAVSAFARLPFSVYLGWITVATVANVTTVLYDARWDGFGVAPEAWAVILLAIGAAIALAMIVTRRDVAYTLVILWAYAGIVVKQSPTAVVAGAAAAGALVVATALIAAILFRRLRPQRMGGDLAGA